MFAHGIKPRPKLQPYTGPAAQQHTGNGHASELQGARHIISDAKIAADSKVELGKLGFDIKVPEASDRSTLLKHRAECRRAVNAVAATVSKNDPATLSDSKLNTIDWLMAQINAVSIELDLQDATAAGHRGSKAGSALVDINGQRIGTVLAAATLRDESTIADAIGVRGDTDMTLSDFFRGVANMRSNESVRNALSEGTDSAGGYTVPTVLLPGILQALVPASSLLSAGANIAMLQDPGKAYTIPAINSIPTASWRLESAALQESDPTFRSITVTPRSLAFIFKVSRELLADSPSIDQALNIAIAQAFAKALDLAGLRGSGTAPEIRGLRNIAGINTTSMGTNGATPTNYSKLVAGWQAITTANAPEPNAAIMHPRDMATFANLADTTGQPLRRPDLLADTQFIQTSQIPTNVTQGTSNDTSEIYQGDFSLFTWYFREQVSIQLLRDLYAATGEVGFACHVRADCSVAYPQAFNVITGVRAV